MNEAAKQEARTLVKKLSEVMGAIDKRIAKNGRNTQQNYSYATEADITAAVREHMSERHLLLMPSVEKTEWETLGTTSKGTPRKLCTLTVKFTLMDGDSGESQTFTVLGQGEDTSDKATYKAMTGATKYALMKLFLIPTGDDPENDSEHSFRPGRQAPAANTDARPAPTAQPRKGTHPGATLAIKYGEGKGKTVGELTDAELAWQLDAADKAVKANDPKWHKANLAKQAALQAEAQTRVSATPSGHIKAPANTSPKQAELAPVDEDEGEEIVTAAQVFARLAREYRMTQGDLAKRAMSALNGKQGPYTHEDLAIVRSSLEAVPHR